MAEQMSSVSAGIVSFEHALTAEVPREKWPDFSLLETTTLDQVSQAGLVLETGASEKPKPKPGLSSIKARQWHKHR